MGTGEFLALAFDFLDGALYRFGLSPHLDQANLYFREINRVLDIGLDFLQQLAKNIVPALFALSHTVYQRVAATELNFQI